jgi:transposase-like protein
MLVVLGGLHQMFEDLINDVDQMRKRFKPMIDIEVCPACRSTKVDSTDGIFIKGGLYIQTMVCIVCKKKWYVIYDSDLNIIEVKIGA